jgi:Tfp pilus assembly protein PilF
VVLTPARAEVHDTLATALRGLGQCEEAEAAFRRALQIEPSAARYTNLGNLLADRGRNDDAERCYRQAVECEPGFALAHHGLAAQLHRRGEIAAAIASYRTATRLDPGRAAVWDHLGVALRAVGRSAEAIDAFHRAVAVDPDFAEAYRQLAECGALPADGAQVARAAARANIIEEIGPIVIWGLARYLASLPLSARPYTVQIMIEGSHLVGDLDERAYITANSANLTQNALVDVTIEHLGGRELMQAPVGGQVPRLDGLLETNWLSVGPIPGTTTTFSDPVVRASIALAKKLGRSFVAPTSLVGLGISGPWRAVTTTTASIDQPAWLLNINMPHDLELNKLMDFQALQTAVEGHPEMLTTFMNTPIADFGKAYVA